MKAVRSLSHRRSDDEREIDAATKAHTKRQKSQRKRAKQTIAPLPQDDAPDDATFRAEWKMTPQQEEERLADFLKQLKDCNALVDAFDKYTYRRFLRARQHDIPRAMEMWVKHLKWRRSMGADTILDDFTFPERDAFISLYPQGYCNVDKMGRPVYIQHVGSINMKKMYELTTEERMLKFHIQEYERCLKYIMPACSRAAGRHIDQTFAILDLKGVGFSHITGEVKKMLSKILSIDQDNYPEMLGHTCIINAGGVFSLLFRFVKPYLDIRTQNKIEVCPRDYVPALLKWIDAENLPTYLGGKSKATLLDDAGPWNDPVLIAQIEAELKAGISKLNWQGSTGGDSPVGGSPQGHSPAHSFVAAEPVIQLTDRRSTKPRETEEDVFFEAESLRTSSVLSVRAVSVATSDAEGDDGEYHSPKSVAESVASGYFSATESNASGLPLQGARSGGRAPPPPLLQSMGPAAMAGRPDESGASSNDEADPRKWTYSAVPTSPVASAAVDARASDVPMRIPLLARVRALEERVQQLKAGTPRKHMPPEGRLADRDLGDGTIMSRVETLEHAVAALTRMQESTVLAAEKRAEEAGCCSACCIM